MRQRRLVTGSSLFACLLAFLLIGTPAFATDYSISISVCSTSCQTSVAGADSLAQQFTLPAQDYALQSLSLNFVASSPATSIDVAIVAGNAWSPSAGNPFTGATLWHSQSTVTPDANGIGTIPISPSFILPGGGKTYWLVANVPGGGRLLFNKAATTTNGVTAGQFAFGASYNPNSIASDPWFLPFTINVLASALTTPSSPGGWSPNTITVAWNPGAGNGAWYAGTATFANTVTGMPAFGEPAQSTVWHISITFATYGDNRAGLFSNPIFLIPACKDSTGTIALNEDSSTAFSIVNENTYSMNIACPAGSTFDSLAVKVTLANNTLSQVESRYIPAGNTEYGTTPTTTASPDCSGTTTGIPTGCPDDSGNPTSSDGSCHGFNPLTYIKCALTWAFVPGSSSATQWQTFQTNMSSKPPFSLISTATGYIGPLLDSGSYNITSDNSQLGYHPYYTEPNQNGRRIDFNPLSEAAVFAKDNYIWQQSIAIAKLALWVGFFWRIYGMISAQFGSKPDAE